MKFQNLPDRIVLERRTENGERIETIAVRHDNDEFEVMDDREGVILSVSALRTLVQWGKEQLNAPRGQRAGAN
jgi:hypothetical protein